MRNTCLLYYKNKKETTHNPSIDWPPYRPTALVMALDVPGPASVPYIKRRRKGKKNSTSALPLPPPPSNPPPPPFLPKPPPSRSPSQLHSKGKENYHIARELATEPHQVSQPLLIIHPPRLLPVFVLSFLFDVFVFVLNLGRSLLSIASRSGSPPPFACPDPQASEPSCSLLE